MLLLAVACVLLAARVPAARAECVFTGTNIVGYDTYDCTGTDADGLVLADSSDVLLQPGSRVQYVIYHEAGVLFLGVLEGTATIDARFGPPVCGTDSDGNTVCATGANAVLTESSFLTILPDSGARLLLFAAGSGIGVRGGSANVNVGNTIIDARAFGIFLGNSSGGETPHQLFVRDSAITSRLQGIRVLGSANIELFNVDITSSTGGVLVVGPGTVGFTGDITVSPDGGAGIVVQGNLLNTSAVLVNPGGTITAPLGVAVGGGNVTNEGTITGNASAVSNFNTGIVVFASPDGSTIVNNGTISQYLAAIQVIGTANITHNGTIENVGNGIVGTDGFTFGGGPDQLTITLGEGSRMTVENTGILVSGPFATITVGHNARILANSTAISSTVNAISVEVQSGAIITGGTDEGDSAIITAETETTGTGNAYDDTVVVIGGTVDAAGNSVADDHAQVLGGIRLGVGNDTVSVGIGPW